MIDKQHPVNLERIFRRVLKQVNTIENEFPWLSWDALPVFSDKFYLPKNMEELIKDFQSRIPNSPNSNQVTFTLSHFPKFIELLHNLKDIYLIIKTVYQFSKVNSFFRSNLKEIENILKEYYDSHSITLKQNLSSVLERLIEITKADMENLFVISIWDSYLKKDFDRLITQIEEYSQRKQ